MMTVVLWAYLASLVWAAWRLLWKPQSLPLGAALLLKGWLIAAVFLFFWTACNFMVPHATDSAALTIRVLLVCAVCTAIVVGVVVGVIALVRRLVWGSSAANTDRENERDARLADDATLRGKGVLDES